MEEGAYLTLPNDDRCLGPQSGEDTGHLHSDIPSPNNNTTSTKADTNNAQQRTHRYQLLSNMLTKRIGAHIVTHFGRVSSSKKPSLVMPRFEPVKRRDTKMALLTRHFQFPVLSCHPELHKGNNSKWGSTFVFHECNGRGH